MLKLHDYIIETIVFARILPVSRDYTIIVFEGRKKAAASNRIIFALVKLDNKELTIADEVTIPSCDMLKENSEILLASACLNISFILRNASTITVSYTDYSFYGEEFSSKESFTFRIQNS